MFLTGFPLLFFSRGLTQALRTKCSDTTCCVLGIRGDMYEDKILLLFFCSESSIAYIYNVCRKEKYPTEITPTN